MVRDILGGWLGILCGCGGHVPFGSLLYNFCGAGGIGLRNSMDRWSGWVFRGLKSWFEVMNIFIFIFLLFLCLFCFVRCSSTILMMENSALRCMSV